MFGRRRRGDKDFFKAEGAQRRKAEDDTPWFLADDDAPPLEVDAGRSARLDADHPLE